MRDVLRTSLAKSLSALSPLDRLAAAWPVVAGHATAERSDVTALDEGCAIVTVPDPSWQKQLRDIAPQLRGDLARISRVPLTDILFVLPAAPGRPRLEPVPPPRKQSAPRPKRKKA